MSLYSDLLFLHGHIADPRLALALSTASPAQASSPGPATGIGIAPTPVINTAADMPAGPAAAARRDPMTLFKSPLYLGGLESIDSRIGEEEEAFGPTYGNRIASERTFGKPATEPFHRRVVQVARNASAPLGCVAGGCG